MRQWRCRVASVRGIQICRVDVERSPHPVLLLSKDIPQQFHIREEGGPQPVRCPSCGELIHPPEFYVRKGQRIAAVGYTAGSRVHPRSLG